MVGPAMFPEVDAILGESKTPRERTEKLASTLHQLLPRAKLVGCRLADGASDSVFVLDDNGTPREDWSQQWDAEEDGDGLLTATKLSIHVVPLEHDGNYYGELAVGFLEQECQAEAKVVVDILGRYLAVCFRLEGEERLRHNLESELVARRSSSATEGIAKVCHDVRNVLNNIMLQMSILKTKVPAETQPVIGLLREQVLKAGDILRAVEQRGA